VGRVNETSGMEGMKITMYFVVLAFFCVVSTSEYVLQDIWPHELLEG